MVDTTSWIGTNLDDLAALAAIHDDGLSHLVAWLLVCGELAACAVCLGFLDLQLHVPIPSKGAPSREFNQVHVIRIEKRGNEQYCSDSFWNLV